MQRLRCIDDQLSAGRPSDFVCNFSPTGSRSRSALSCGKDFIGESFVPQLAPFHIAFPVDDLDAARAFYTGVLGCAEGRSSAEWVDFNLFGHQIVAHLVHRRDSKGAGSVHNPVDGHDVPVPHFGVVLTPEDWSALAQRVRAAGVVFGIEPHTRFAGQPGEQSTMFFRDPAGNALEFKAFADLGRLFAK